jgi:hypothetical protein
MILRLVAGVPLPAPISKWCRHCSPQGAQGNFLALILLECQQENIPANSMVNGVVELPPRDGG